MNAKDENRLRELAKEMNEILNRSSRPSFYDEPPKYRYDKEKDGYQLRLQLETDLMHWVDKGHTPTRVELSPRTHWLMGLTEPGNDILYVRNRNKQIYIKSGAGTVELDTYLGVKIVVRRDIYLVEGQYNVYTEDERIW